MATAPAILHYERIKKIWLRIYDYNPGYTGIRFNAKGYATVIIPAEVMN